MCIRDRFDTVTTGAANDIEKATRIARAMVTQYGMSEKFGLMGLEHQENEYLTGRVVMNCGDATAAEVDQEVMKILKKSYEEAKRLLSENRDAMDKIAAVSYTHLWRDGRAAAKGKRYRDGGCLIWRSLLGFWEFCPQESCIWRRPDS